MGLRYYDEALHTLISRWVGKKNIRVLRPDETSALFSINADINEDKALTLPLIALSRNTSIEILQPKKTLLSFDGKHLKSTVEETIQLNAIPIQLAYQIDIYTKDFEDADEYVREFVFAIINNPVLKINIPYNGINLSLEANMRIQSTITDNSDIPERLFRDQFTRFTIQVELQDAYLFSVPINKNASIEDGELLIIKPDSNTVEHKEKLYVK